VPERLRKNSFPLKISFEGNDTRIRGRRWRRCAYHLDVTAAVAAGGCGIESGLHLHRLQRVQRNADVLPRLPLAFIILVVSMPFSVTELLLDALR